MKKIVFAPALLFAAFFFLQALPGKEEPATKAELGQLLFFDPILSSDKTISCASCHKPAFAFADTLALSIGVQGRVGKRNTPSSMNVRLRREFFWDGRAPSLEEQALMPIENPDEMNLSIDSAIQRLNNDDGYSAWFLKIFAVTANRENLGAAIAAFERSLETSNSAFDRWKFLGDSNAVGEDVKRGFNLFNTKGKCITCHFGGDFTANEFRNIGLFDGEILNDSGRAAISHAVEDAGKFKTAGLRNLTVTAPYMHDGRFKTLREVLRFYNDPEKVIPGSLNRDTLLLKPLGLTEQEINDLEAFLISLTDNRFF